MTKYGRSPWVETFPKSRIPAYRRHRGSDPCPVVIIGGGLTGCATAYAFAAAGIKVMLLEADRIGGGETSSAFGWISGDPGVSFAPVEQAIGRRDARHAFEAWHRAALDFQTLLRRLDIKCHLQAGGALTVATTPEQIARLKKEQKVRRDAGLNAPLLNAAAVKRELAIDGAIAIRDKAAASLDPYRACLGLAEAAAKRGAAIYERSPVKRTTFTRRTATVVAAEGSIKAERIVVATGAPTRLFASLERHFWYHTTYLALTQPIPARIRRQLGSTTTILRDSADPPHLVRWAGGDRLLVCGADGPEEPERLRGKTVVQRTGQLMYELSTIYPDISGLQPEYGWASHYTRTTDGLPYIGPHRNFPFHLFAFGDSSRSVTGAYLASRLLLRRHLEGSDSGDEAFAFTRYER
jgi:glycine/D-amino acid oxidase-like deaminating enzyme